MSDAILETALSTRRAFAARGWREWSGTMMLLALITRVKATAWLLIFPAVTLPIWIIGSERGWLAEQILPRPADVLHTLNEMLASGELAQHAGISLLRVLLGFAV
ncbi:MAG: ABC transporter permease, partial [Bradyrhizobium sp.]